MKHYETRTPAMTENQEILKRLEDVYQKLDVIIDQLNTNQENTTKGWADLNKKEVK